MVDERIEDAVFALLECHSFEEILSSLHGYAETQSRLATLLHQSIAGQDWQVQATALKMARSCLCERDALAVVEGE